MTPSEELAEVDAEWDAISASEEEGTKPPDSGGSFGHPSERRLGLRVPAGCWALLRDGERSVYARAVELSPTGTVLKLVDGNGPRFDDARGFELDIFVPGATRPVHATARSVRAIGELEAFEFSAMSAADRLTLAEHLDRLVASRPSSKLPQAELFATAPPVFWKNFVLSLKRRSRPIPVQRL